MKRRHQLSSEVTREIVLLEVRENGPISVWEMYAKLKKIFRDHSNVDCRDIISALSKHDCGLAIIEGVIDIVPKGLSPISRSAVLRDVGLSKLKLKGGKSRAKSSF